MCGIYGINRQISRREIADILELIKFRGPDYSGFSINNNYSFGHNRLAIIDLDPRSGQPFRKNGYEIVFNGEIYNYKDIRKDLISKGHIFFTDSDTEVLLTGYMEYGENILSKVNGMFAFVIYDPKKNLFFGARDRLGKKPLYYYLKDKTFEFASQIKQIIYKKNLKISEIGKKLYFRFGYIPEPYTIFEDIYKLEAGYYFIYDLNLNFLKKEKYWDISLENEYFEGSYLEIKESLKELLIDAVEIRLNSDVPVGIFLSGGIDSSLVASLIVKELGYKLESFSIKFSPKEFDESSISKEVAKYLGIKHYVFELKKDDVISLIEDYNEYFDEPFSDASALAVMLLSKKTRKYVTVSLSGDGGDELFWGYNNFFRLAKVSKLYKLPKFVRVFLGNIIALLPNYRLKKIGNGLKTKNLEELFLYMDRLFNFKNLFNQDNIQILDNYKKYLYNNKKNIFDRISDYSIKMYLNGDIFTKIDRGSMAYSLEVRSPIVDYRIVEFSQKIPLEYKYKKGKGKLILRDILYEYLPNYIFERPKKGFTVPLKELFRNELKEYVYDVLSEENLKKIKGININYVQKLLNNHMAGKENNYHQIWTLIAYIKWMEKYGGK